MRTAWPGSSETYDGRNHYVATADGQRFLIITPVDEPTAPIVVVLDWAEELERMTAAGGS